MMYFQNNNNNKNKMKHNNTSRVGTLLSAICAGLLPNLAFAADASASSAVTNETLQLIWIGLCAILVLFMQSGF